MAPIVKRPKFQVGQALGLPKGSVRAILALSLVGATVALAFVGVVPGDKVASLAELTVVFYFGLKATAK